MHFRSLAMLGAFLLATFAAAAAGAFAGPGDWYAQLRKPPGNPPGWVFGPVWTTLYTLMAVAAWLVWRERSRGAASAAGAVRGALVLFFVQLALNAAWSPLFFAAQRPGWAFVDLCAMWVAILATIVAFRRVRPLASVLMLPYLAWVTFAGYLNFMIWRLNA
jgi:tryptophan-rich sensory protein